MAYTAMQRKDPPGQKSKYIPSGNIYEELYRLATFENFPYDKVLINPSVFAKYGFLYTGYEDAVKCFSCGSYVENLEQHKDPTSASLHLASCNHKDQKDPYNISRKTCHNWNMLSNQSVESNKVLGYKDIDNLVVYVHPGDRTSEKYRLTTFQNFPQLSPINVSNLAANGFVYNGIKNIVQCFSCGKKIKIYKDDDFSKYHKIDCEFKKTYQPLKRLLDEKLGDKKGIVADKNSSENHQIKILACPVKQLMTSGVEKAQKIVFAEIESSLHEELLSNLDLWKEEDRRRSFAQSLELFDPVKVVQLSAAGFFYLGVGDSSQCFSCSSVLENWNTSNLDPHQLHQAKCPSCKMAKGIDLKNIPDWYGYGSGLEESPLPSEEEIQRLKSTYECLNPSNPSMKSYEARLRSFAGRWPISSTCATPQQISTAGFFCLGQGDKAKCWYCNGVIQRWGRNDDPWIEHAKFFPRCAFLLQSRGNEFVQSILPQYNQSDEAETPDLYDEELLRTADDIVMDLNLFTSKRQSSTQVEIPSKKSKDSAEEERSRKIQRAEEMGFARSVIETKLKSGNFSFKELLDALLLDTVQDEEKYLSKSLHVPTHLRRGLQQDNLYEELTALELNRLCKSCEEKPADHMLLPCAHICLCEKCSLSKKLSKCPTCGRKVEDVIQTFVS